MYGSKPGSNPSGRKYSVKRAATPRARKPKFLVKKKSKPKGY